MCSLVILKNDEKAYWLFCLHYNVHCVYTVFISCVYIVCIFYVVTCTYCASYAIVFVYAIVSALLVCMFVYQYRKRL